MAVVADRMTSPAITLPASTPLAEVLRVLESRAVSAVPLVQDGRLVGIVSTTDLMRHLGRFEEGAAASRASEIMRSPVLTVGPNDGVELAARRMSEGRVHRLVVVEEGAPVGVISARDLLEDMKRLRVTAPLSTVMTEPVQTIEVGDTIDVAMGRLAAANVHGLVVVDGEFPVGVFTHAEALAATRLPAELRARPVEEVMSYETICFDASTPLYRVAGHAISMNVRRILAVQKRRLVGVVSSFDLVRFFADPSSSPARPAEPRAPQ